MNAGVLQRGLCRQVGPIQGGEVESLLLDFERPRGEQSNPLATVVADVILTCDTERGPGYHLMPVNPTIYASARSSFRALWSTIARREESKCRRSGNPRVGKKRRSPRL